MILESREKDQIAIQGEGWHLIFDRFLRGRRGLFNRGPYFSQNFSDLLGEASDIFINGLRVWFPGFYFDLP